MIVPVKKAKIFVLEEDRVDLLLALQKSELFMVSNDSKTEVAFNEDDRIIQRAENVLKELTKYQEKKSFFEYHTVEYDDFILDDIKRYDLLEDLETSLERLVTLKERNAFLENEKKRILPFKDMPYSLSDLRKSLYVTFKVGFIPENNIVMASSFFEENKIEHELYELSKYGYPVIFVLDKDEEDSLIEKINSFNFINADLSSYNNKVPRELESIDNEFLNNSNEIVKLEEELANSKEIEIELKILIDQLESKKERLSVNFKETSSTIYVEGWVREDQVEDLENVVKLVTTSYELDISEANEEEEVPTATKNNKFVHQFETITNMFSVPKHNEIDPNPVMSIWYWIIFGIMMGDVGYGLVMIVLFGLFIKLKKPKGSLSQLVHVLFYSGFTAVFAGIVFGSVFGFSVPILELVGLKSYSVIDDPMPMLIFSMGIGVLHLISALVLKVVLSVKQKDILSGLADGVSWILILTGGSLFALTMANIGGSILTIISLILVGIGVLLILTLSGRDKKGVFSKITSGLGGIYNSTGYLSDLLSYSRILALSLSSAVIATTMNLLAGLVQGSFIGIIFSVVIYIVGHTFNFAMGLLSAYVHDSRLQYIEFFGKFYEGGGVMYEPLSLKTKYINEISK